MATVGDTVLAVFCVRHMLYAASMVALDVAPSWSMYELGIVLEF
jgi:hypothetical protein